MGAPVIKVPVPDGAPPAPSAIAPWPGSWRSVSVPVLFLGGPRATAGRDRRPRRGARRHGGRRRRHGHGAHRLPGPRPGDRWRASAAGWCTAGDPHRRLRDHVTKVGLWDDDGLVALALPLGHHVTPQRAGRSRTRCAGGPRSSSPVPRHGTGAAGLGSVDVVGCSGARQTFARVGAAQVTPRQGHPVVGPPRRPPRRAALAERMGGDDINRARPGIPLDAGAVAAKLAWLAAHEPRSGGAAARDPVPPRPDRVPHDRPGGDRRDLGLA